jgi:hypothetical protein
LIEQREPNNGQKLSEQIKMQGDFVEANKFL